MAVQIKNLRIKNLALLKIAAEGVETLQEQMRHVTASHMSNWRKGYLIQQILTPLKPQVGVKMTPQSTSNPLSRFLLWGGQANSMIAKLTETEELEHTRIKVSLQNLSLAFTVRYKIIFPSRFCLIEYTWWASPWGLNKALWLTSPFQHRNTGKQWMEKKPWKDEKVSSQAYTLFTLTTYSLHVADNFSFL